MESRWRAALSQLAARAGLGDVSPSLVLSIAAVAVVLVGLAGWRWWPRTPSQEMQVSRTATPAPQQPEPRPAEEATETMCVHVVGAVRRPGVYDLPTGTRVGDAVDAAGGLLPDAVASAVNLARLVTDGEQVMIPDEDQVAEGVAPAVAGAAAVSGAGGAAGGPAATALVNINTADEALLDTLPGVGPSTASKIVSERETNGPFASVDDLGRVSGIGPKRLDQLKDLVCVQ